MFARQTDTCTQQYLISANMSDRSTDANTGREILWLAEQRQDEMGISAMQWHGKLRLLMHDCVEQIGVLVSYLGGMHDLLANIHLPEALKDSQKGYVQPLSGHLIIPGSMEAAAHNAM